MAINDRSEKKNKSIAFIFNTEENEVQCEMDTKESISDAIVLLGIEFNKVLNRWNKILTANVKDEACDNFKNIGFQRKSKYEGKKLTKGKEYNFMNARVLVMSELSVPCS